jgi:hypothetical protein
LAGCLNLLVDCLDWFLEKFLLAESASLLVKSMQLKRVAFSLFLLGVGTYIWLPTPDEIAIYPVLGFFLSYLLNVSLFYGIVFAMVIYRGIGSACLLSALLIGGKTAYQQFIVRFKRKSKTTTVNIS